MNRRVKRAAVLNSQYGTPLRRTASMSTSASYNKNQLTSTISPRSAQNPTRKSKHQSPCQQTVSNFMSPSDSKGKLTSAISPSSADEPELHTSNVTNAIAAAIESTTVISKDSHMKKKKKKKKDIAMIPQGSTDAGASAGEGEGGVDIGNGKDPPKLMVNSNNGTAVAAGDASTSMPSSLKQKSHVRKRESTRKLKTTSLITALPPQKSLIQQADETMAKYCTTVPVNIHPTLVPFILPTTTEKD